MNIPDMKIAVETDLERFLLFSDNLNCKRVKVIKEDWDNMCGITIIEDGASVSSRYATFAFETDGSFRGLYTGEEPIKNVPEGSIFTKLLNKSFWS